MLYADLTYSALNDAARSAFEALMQSGTYEYQSEFARKYFEGIKRAHQESEQDAVLKVLTGRGLPVDDETRRHIRACTDREQLERWLLKALTVTSAPQLFE